MTKEEKRAYDRAWHARRSPEGKARKVALQGQRRAAIYKAFAEYKVSRGCLCGERHPACLELHHRDGADKEINVGDSVGRGWSLARILSEAAKCDVMCANCHRKLHAQERLAAPTIIDEMFAAADASAYHYGDGRNTGGLRALIESWRR